VILFFFCFPRYKTKTAENTIAKLGTGIVHQNTSPTNEYSTQLNSTQVYFRHHRPIEKHTLHKEKEGKHTKHYIEH